MVFNKKLQLLRKLTTVNNIYIDHLIRLYSYKNVKAPTE